MTFGDAMNRIRRMLLCCGGEKRKRPLEIGSPTNVQKGVLDIPGLSQEQITFIREKASADATRLLSTTSHPPTRPSTPTSKTSPPSVPQLCTPSPTLLNSASTNLPTALPTPPPQQHSSPVPPPSAHNRMKGFWERSRRLSNAFSTNSHKGYEDLRLEERIEDEGVAMLNLDLELVELESASSTSGKSALDGFETQGVVGATAVPKYQGRTNEPLAKAPMTENRNAALSNGHDSSSSSEDERDAKTELKIRERKPLVGSRN